MSLRLSAASIALALLIAFTTPSLVRGQVYVEEFDGPVQSIMLNGVLDFGSNGAWSTRVTNGALELENRTADNAVRYYKVERVIYPGRSGPVATEDATIEAVVRVTGEERSGAGVIVRFDPKSKDYLFFAIGPKGTFYTLLRKEQKATFVGAGLHDAIKVGEPNRLLVKTLGSTLVFEVNGREVTRMAGEDSPGRLVGIAAFGRGTFDFDRVRIAPPGVDLGPAP
jgi:hypothetical protein